MRYGADGRDRGFEPKAGAGDGRKAAVKTTEHRPDAGDVDLHAGHRVRLAIPDRGGAGLRQSVPLLLGRLQLLPVRAFPTDRILQLAADARNTPPAPGWCRSHSAITRKSTDLRSLIDMGYSIAGIAAPGRPHAPTLQMLRESGERSITIAPEAGSDRLRRVINKTVTNQEILGRHRADLRQRHGEPEAVLHDRPAHRNRRRLVAIRDLTVQMREIMMHHAKNRGRIAASSAA